MRPSPWRPLLAALVAAALTAAPGSAGLNRWTSSGPYGAPALDTIAVDPTDPDRIAVVRAARGVHVSEDGGQSWHPRVTGNASLGWGVIAWDPFVSGRLYHGIRGLLRSDDAGRTWQQVSDISVGGLLTDPLVPGRLVAFDRVAVWESLDSGATWTALDSGWPGGQPQALALAPSDPRILYVSFLGGSLGFHRHDFDAATSTWRWQVADGGTPCRASALAVDPLDPQRAWAAGTSGDCGLPRMARTTDGGRSWAPVPGVGLPTSAIRLLLADPAEPTLLMAVGYRAELHVSGDGGDTWSAVSADLAPDVPQAIALARGTPRRVLVATTYGGVRAADLGSWTWTRLQDGLDGALVRAVAPACPDPRVLLAGVEQFSWAPFPIWATRNAGASWEPTSSPAESTPTSLACDPTRAGAFHLSAVQGAVHWTPDVGGTWEARTTGVPEMASLWPIRVDPFDPSRLVAVDACAGQLLRSVDGGMTWATTTAGLEGWLSSFATFDVATPGRVVASTSTPDRAEWGTHVSVDGGASWQPGPSSGLGWTHVLFVRGTNWLASARAGDGAPVLLRHDEASGAWERRDAGLPTGSQVPLILSLVADPRDELGTFVALLGFGTWHTADEGRSWCSLADPNPQAMFDTLSVTSAVPPTLNVGTTGGVWSVTLDDSAVAVRVTKVGGDAVLTWTGEGLTVVVRRGADPRRLTALAPCGSASPLRDAVVGDGQAWFYRVGY